MIRNRHLKMNTICRYNIAFFIFIKNVLQIYIVFFLVGYSSSNSCRFFHASVYWPILYYLFVEIRLGSTCSISLKVFFFYIYKFIDFKESNISQNTFNALKPSNLPFLGSCQCLFVN